MIALLPILFAAAVAAAPPPAQSAQPQDFDQTVDVARGVRLSVENNAGGVVMRVWDRDAVRVTARQSARARAVVRNADNTVWVSSRGMGSVDFEITVPSWMPVKVTGQYNYIELNGMGSEVTAENVRGDIDIKGGRGFITAKSIEGNIMISGVEGKVSAVAVNEHVTISNASGELMVDATNGNVTMTDIKATTVSVAALNGTVRFAGTLADKGRYAFTTHNGSIILQIQPNPNATFYVRSYEGTFRQNLNLKPQGDIRSGRRNTFIGGTGSAQVELESFNGSLRVYSGSGGGGER
jgi:hypothetical protein